MPDRDLTQEYTQPIRILDLAWDALMLETLETLKQGHAHSVMANLLLKGVQPCEICHIIDVAITAYRREAEGSGARPTNLGPSARGRAERMSWPERDGG